jgi:hypothetical protein
MIEYIEKFEIINQTQEIPSDCNELTLINTGTSIVTLNGLVINPGGQYVSSGNQNEINRSRYKLIFATIGTNEIFLIRKIYK